MSINDRVRACLLEGPTTSSEVAVTIGVSIKNACARLRHLEQVGQAQRTGTRIGRAFIFAPTPSTPAAGAVYCAEAHTWELLPQGEQHG